MSKDQNNILTFIQFQVYTVKDKLKVILVKNTLLLICNKFHPIKPCLFTKESLITKTLTVEHMSTCIL